MESTLVSRSRLSAGVAALAIAAAATTGCASWGGGGPTPPTEPPTTAEVQISTSFSSFGAPSCTNSTGATWGVTPLEVPAGSGRHNPITERSEPSGTFPASGGRCTLNYLFRGLDPGRWRVWVDAGAASGVCEATLSAGKTLVSFDEGSPCSVTP